ncbi:aldo/keto reductase [Bifidobacterium eulemuris]|uniref:Aldo/keto reductase n=1 Tax=Bifidobacterium eulemuris TaxID=1765219 RepID=A0A261GD49_9BIFI|nr:aldo/keto reductase [Bifidobacterium eulemuris]OZG69334.1 oxidoreductase [Bifidobacterium eulemuris]QOL31170.1 aldo/keto reductase [Bifidobacterium eulemuris]
MQHFTMNNGAAIPALGFGVFQMTSKEVDEHLPQAIAAGYTHIDTANAYFNEVAVGRAIKASGVKREDLFVTTKLFPQSYPYEQCAHDIDATLERLDMDYIDLLLFHQPYGDYVSGWKAMEEAVAAGKVKSIGLSNFPVHKIRQILDVADITPAVLQVEINPYWNQHALKSELADLNLVFEGWYPLGHGDQTLLAEPVFARFADKYGKTAAQIILRWHLQEGNVTFPKTCDPQHIKDNIDIFDFALTDDEMAEINALPQRPYYTVPEEAPDFVLRHNDYSQQA